MPRLRPRIEPGSGLWLYRRNKVAMGSTVVMLIIVIAALLAPWVAPYPEQGAGTPNALQALLGPSWSHPLGTDELGRDELSRLMFGARSSLMIGAIVVAIGVTVGTTLGAIAGYAGGWIDELIMRVTDVFLSFPALLLAILLATTLQPSSRTAIIAISVTWWPWYTRLVRAEAIAVRERRFVAAARVVGVRPTAILVRHVLPNILGPVRVQATLDIGAAIVAGASLSFLALGPQPPTADWGAMISSGRQYLISGQWWMSVFPGLAIVICVVALSLIGDGYSSALSESKR
jgi:peptide/nickel transport system permease protein